MGLSLSVRYNREIVITVKIYVVKMSVIFYCYSREFVVTMIVRTKFDCTVKNFLYYYQRAIRDHIKRLQIVILLFDCCLVPTFNGLSGLE